MSSIFPVMLAGGTGTRLWPMSRKTYPKQFIELFGEKTLFQQLASRLTSSAVLKFGSHLTITNEEYRFIVAEQMQAIGLDVGTIIIEPEPKNTAPAILTAALHCVKQEKDGILLVAPSDHLIPDTERFHETIRQALKHCKENMIVTFGIPPTNPETGYGYIEVESQDDKNFRVKNFIEKPGYELACEMIKCSNFFWNAGIFLAKAEVLIETFKSLTPELYKNVLSAYDRAEKDLDFTRLDKVSWKRIDPESIDYAIIEKVKNLAFLPLACDWSDLGDWDAIWKQSPKDSDGVVKLGDVHSFECGNSLLSSVSLNHTVVGIGLENMLVVSMADAVLVANRADSQRVKVVVDKLRELQVPQADVYPKDHRPWGWFESLLLADGFQVKRLVVKPGRELSLQSHEHRSEHWIVVEGNATVIIDNAVNTITTGESIFIPKRSKHRLRNNHSSQLVVIEVQLGDYLGEDDIIRYEDIYSR